MESPRRNFRGELLTALAAISMLGLAIVFAVVLTADTLPGVSPAPSPTVQSMAPTQAPSALPTETPLPLPPSITPKPTATVPVATAQGETASPAAVTQARSSSEPSATAEASATPRPSTTPSPTRTPTLTRTPTRTPSPQPTSTWTPSVTPTETPVPTDTRVYTPTVTSPPAQSATPRPTLTSQPTVPGTCAPPPGWQPYVIQSGDNLFRLALRSGLSTAELQQVNCIANAASITTGQVIYLPPTLSPTGAPPGTTAPASTSTGSSGGSSPSTARYPLSLGCLLTQIRFSSPVPGSTLSGRVTLRGTATLSNLPSFEYYKVELRGSDGVYRHVAQSANPAPGPDSVLALLNTTEFARGEYQLVLTVVDRTGNFPEPCAIRVAIQN